MVHSVGANSANASTEDTHLSSPFSSLRNARGRKGRGESDYGLYGAHMEKRGQRE